MRTEKNKATLQTAKSTRIQHQRQGPHINSLDEATAQGSVYWKRKSILKWNLNSWSLGFVSRHLGPGREIRYAMPNDVVTRFSDEEVLLAEKRLKTEPTIKGRRKLMRLLNQWDQGFGDVEDVLDCIEDALPI